MMRFPRMMAALVLSVACLTSAAQPATAQGGVTWLIIVDDLHLDFRNTGRLRDLLRLMSSELIQEGDVFAFRSTGPSSLTLGFTRDRSLIAPSIRKVTGNGLRASDSARDVADPSSEKEVRYRAAIAFSAAHEAIKTAPAGRTAMIHVSNGYIADHEVRDHIPELTRAANETDVTIFAVDPRGLMGVPEDDLVIGPIRLKIHLAATRESLRMLSDPTGGFLLFEAADLAPGLKRIGSMVRQ